MAKKYFSKNASGLNADIERHRERMVDLEQRLAEAESKGRTVVANAYRNLIAQLNQSKAETTNKLGRK